MLLRCGLVEMLCSKIATIMSAKRNGANEELCTPKAKHVTTRKRKKLVILWNRITADFHFAIEETCNTKTI